VPVERSPNAAPPTFLQLAGHPLRWQLLRELAQSDRQVRELTKLLGTQQSLVSYHLARLRKGRLVSMRRSSADGRDAYYRVDLARCRELLAAAGGALHPGLALGRPVGNESATQGHPIRVLFLCTGNSTRSQIAEALLKRMGGESVEVESAGSHPKSVHENTARVLGEQGIDISSKRSQPLSRFARERFDYVVTLCDRVREVAPECSGDAEFPGSAERIHWSIADPALEGDTNEESYPAFVRTTKEIEDRVRFLLHAIRQQPVRR
jgi:protein-tyrosine-phosphatase/DNA-binding transcriptional ArsR family regulator